MLRNVPVRQQPDYRRHSVRMRSGMHFGVVHLFGLCHALQHQDHRAPDCGNVDRLVCGVQDEDRFVHQGRTPWQKRVVGSTAGGTFGTLGDGHSHARCFGGIAPPGVHRLVPVCAHRVFLRLSYHSTELGRGFLTARAIVNPVTDLAPASRSARAQASRVAPVVNTSSTSKTRRLSTWLPWRVAKAPRTDSHRSSKLSICFSVLARVRIKSPALCANCSRVANGFEISAAWL